MVTFPSAAAGPSFAAAAADVAGRPPSGSSACGGVKVEVELDPGASVVDCDVEDAVAFASWSVYFNYAPNKRSKWPFKSFYVLRMF